MQQSNSKGSISSKQQMINSELSQSISALKHPPKNYANISPEKDKGGEFSSRGVLRIGRRIEKQGKTTILGHGSLKGNLSHSSANSLNDKEDLIMSMLRDYRNYRI
jgi:hypothetical protein